MERSEEKLESLEQVIEALVGQFKELEEPLRAFLKVKAPNYDVALEKIYSVLDTSNKSTEIRELTAAVKSLSQKVDTVPNPIRVQTKNSYDIKSKFFFWGAVVVFLSVAISVGLAVFFGVRNSELSGEANRFKVVRAYYLDVANAIDSAYLKNRDTLMHLTGVKIQERNTLSDAEYRELEKKREYEEAKERKDALKNKNKKRK